MAANNIDAHLMMEARNYAVHLQCELDNARKSHYEDVEQIRTELEATREELRLAHQRLNQLDQVLNGGAKCDNQATPKQPRR